MNFACFGHKYGPEEGREGGREGKRAHLDVELGGVLGRNLFEALLEQVSGPLQLAARIPVTRRGKGGRRS